MPPLHNLTGMKFGQWRVIRRVKNRGRHTHWLCECSCDDKSRKNVSLTNLLAGASTNCGCRRHQRLPRGEAGFKLALIHYKNGARRGNREWHLTNQSFREMVTSPCFYCQSSLENKITSGKQVTPEAREWSTFIYTGIDRMDSRKGYSVDNCVPCCSTCNFMKRHLEISEFYKILRRIIKHQPWKRQ